MQATVLVGGLSFAAAAAAAPRDHRTSPGEELERLLESPAAATLVASERAAWRRRLETWRAESADGTLVPSEVDQATRELASLLAERYEVSFRVALYESYRHDRAEYERRMADYRAARGELADAGERLDWLAAASPPPIMTEDFSGQFAGVAVAPPPNWDVVESPTRSSPPLTPNREEPNLEPLLLADAPPAPPLSYVAPRLHSPAPAAETPTAAPARRAETPTADAGRVTINESELAAAVDGVNFAAGLLVAALDQESWDAESLAALHNEVEELLRRRRSLDLYLALTQPPGDSTWRTLDALARKYQARAEAMSSTSSAAERTLAPVLERLRTYWADARVEERR